MATSTSKRNSVVVVWWEGAGQVPGNWQYRDTRGPDNTFCGPFTPTPALIAVLNLTCSDIQNNFGAIWVLDGKEFDFLMSQVVTAK